MGSYCYRPTLKTVELANGQDATVYVFSHKVGCNDSKFERRNDNWFLKYRDRLCEWAVLGTKRDDGKVEVHADSDGKPLGARFQTNGDRFDDWDCAEASKPVWASSGVLLVRSERVTTETGEGTSAGYTQKYVFDLREQRWKAEGPRRPWRSFSFA